MEGADQGLDIDEIYKFLKMENHFYNPIILSKIEINYDISHVINVDSEHKFLEDLSNNLDENEISPNWWMFSRINEHTDKIYVPYYDPEKALMRKFYPDFIFWFKKNSTYSIILLDPKGMRRGAYTEKIKGFERIFGARDNKTEFTFEHEGETLKVKVYLILYTIDENIDASWPRSIDKYFKIYWENEATSITELLKKEWAI